MSKDAAQVDADEIARLPIAATVQEVADVLRIGRDTIERELRALRFPGRKVGGRWVIYRHTLVQYLEGSWTPPRVKKRTATKKSTALEGVKGLLRR